VSTFPCDSAPCLYKSFLQAFLDKKNQSAGQLKVEDKLRQFSIIWHNASEPSAKKLKKNIPFPLSSLPGVNTTTNNDKIPTGGQKMRKMKPEWTPPSLNGQKTVAFYLFC
jgi:hypothetical protein